MLDNIAIHRTLENSCNCQNIVSVSDKSMKCNRKPILHMIMIFLFNFVLIFGGLHFLHTKTKFCGNSFIIL